MHLSTILLLVFCQDGLPQKSVADIESTDPAPRIQPFDIGVLKQTKHKPVLQDSGPPSSFIPPGTSTPPESSFSKGFSLDDSSSNFETKSDDESRPLRSSAAPGSTFDPGSNTIRRNRSQEGTKLESEGNSSFDPQGTYDPTAKATTDSQESATIISGNPDVENTTPRIQPQLFGDRDRTNQTQETNQQIDPLSASERNRSRPAQLPSSIPGSQSTFGTGAAESRVEPTRIVHDDTFDPTLKLISERILESVPRQGTQRLSLAQVVHHARNPTHRKELVKTYWNAFSAQADAFFANQETAILKQLPQPASRLEQSLLTAALSSAKARQAEADIELESARSNLAKSVSDLDLQKSITFSDLPWVGKYKTGSEQFIASGKFDPKISQVDKMLVSVRNLMHLRAAAVYDNLQARQEAMISYQQGALGIATVLDLQKEVRDQRIKFLTSVNDYNSAIADYAISVFPQTSDSEVVAGMLIDTERTLPTDIMLDNRVRQASGIQETREGSIRNR